MWVRHSSWFAAASLLVVACSPDATVAGPQRRALASSATSPPPTAPTAPTSPPGPPTALAPITEASPGAPPLTPALVAAFTDLGALAVVDAASGALVAASEGGGARPVDVAYDAARARIVTIETDEDDAGGEVAVYAFDGAHALGPREHLVFVDGRLRVLPTAEGLVAFEEGYAERWKLLATLTPGVAAGGPTSAWAASGWVATTANALVATRGDGTTSLAWVSADVTASGIVTPVTHALLDEPWPERTDARLVTLGPLSTPLLIERAGGDLAIRSVTAAGFGPALVAAPAVGGHIEGAVALTPSRLAVALSQPARVGFVSLDDPARPSWSQVTLASSPLPSERLPARNLARLGPARVLVATSGGVVSVSVAGGDPTLDAPFAGGALRGPIATIE